MFVWITGNIRSVFLVTRTEGQGDRLCRADFKSWRVWSFGGVQDHWGLLLQSGRKQGSFADPFYGRARCFAYVRRNWNVKDLKDRLDKLEYPTCRLPFSWFLLSCFYTGPLSYRTFIGGSFRTLGCNAWKGQSISAGQVLVTAYGGSNTNLKDTNDDFEPACNQQTTLKERFQTLLLEKPMKVPAENLNS